MDTKACCTADLCFQPRPRIHNPNDDYPQPDSDFPVSDKPDADFPIPNSATPATGHSNRRTLFQHFPNSKPSQFEHRLPTRSHRVPSRFACSASTVPYTTSSSLFSSNSEQAEFSIKKGLLMNSAFLQLPLPVTYYGRLPADRSEPYGNTYVKILRCIYGARISNMIFDDDQTKLLLSLG